MSKKSSDYFDFSALRQNDKVIFFKDKFLMGDNLGRKLKIEEYGKYFNLNPLKAQFTLFLFCRKGRMKIRINFKDYELTACDSVVVLPNSLSQVLELDEDTELIMLGFADGLQFQSVSVSESAQFYNQLRESPMLSLPEDKCEAFISTYRLLRADMANPEFGYKNDALQGYIQVLLAHARHWITSYRKQDLTQVLNRATQIYMDFVKLVQEFHGHHRDVAFYANKMCLTSKYLSQSVLSASEKHPLDIIREQVLFEAKALLRCRKYSVQEVAYMLNFPNPSFFCKYFRKEVGCSPRTYMMGDEL